MPGRPGGLLLLALLGCGESREVPVPAAQMPPGMWIDSHFAPAAGELLPEERERLEALGLLGYASALPAREGGRGVTLNQLTGAGGAPLLYTSGHAAEAILIDTTGARLWSWSFPFERLAHQGQAVHPTRLAWRRARVCANGDLVALHDGVGLLRVDRDSRLLFWHEGGEHHDLQLAADGTIFVLTRRATRKQELGGRPILEDFLAQVSLSGELLREWSLVDALLQAGYEDLLGPATDQEDLLHANSLEPLTQAFARRAGQGLLPGGFLISLREPSAIVALQEGRITRVWQGSFRRQHDARCTERGTLVLFDNMGASGSSRALELDPSDGRESWEWRGEGGEGLFSPFCGSVQALPEGRVLITESTRGRAFLVDREGGILWRFESPHRAGQGGRLVACLYALELLQGPVEGLGTGSR